LISLRASFPLLDPQKAMPISQLESPSSSSGPCIVLSCRKQENLHPHNRTSPYSPSPCFAGASNLAPSILSRGLLFSRHTLLAFLLTVLVFFFLDSLRASWCTILPLFSAPELLFLQRRPAIRKYELGPPSLFPFWSLANFLMRPDLKFYHLPRPALFVSIPPSNFLSPSPETQGFIQDPGFCPPSPVAVHQVCIDYFP